LPFHRSHLLLVASLLAGASLAPTGAYAQGWAGAPGSGSVSLSYQYTKVDYHLFAGDLTGFGGDAKGRLDLGDIVGQSAFVSGSYVVWPNLSVNASIAYVGAKYMGENPESAGLDNGKFHGDLQDASFGARYTAPLGTIALTPFASYSFPTHEYEHHGHVAVGRGNDVFTLGATASRALAPWVPGAYLALSYGHDFVKDISIWGLDGDRYGLDVGFSVLPELSARGYFSYYQIKDGVDWYNDDFRVNQAGHFHDAAAATLQRRAGGAVYYRLRSDKTLYLDIGGVLSGFNTHDGVSYTLGTSWDFMGPFGRR